MKVLIWTELFWPYIGGVEKVVSDLILELREQGFEFTVVTSQDNLELPDRDAYQGIPIYRFPFRRALKERAADAFFRLRGEVSQLKRTIQPDLVHVQSLCPSALFHLLSRPAWPAPTLFTLQQEIVTAERTAGTLTYKLLQESDWVTAVSGHALRQAGELTPEIRGRSSLIYNFDSLPIRIPSPLSYHPPRLLCLGRLIRQKGFDLALEAFAVVRERHPNARLILAGDGSERPALESLAIRLGVKDSVEFLGWVAPDRVMDLLDGVSLLVMPSRMEGLPVVAVQAALAARPVVAAAVSGIPEVVRHEQTGLLFEKENVQALAEALLRALSDPDSAWRWGQSARERAEKLFSKTACVRQYQELYRMLQAGFARPPAEPALVGPG